jgi:hypothetical protein
LKVDVRFLIGLGGGTAISLLNFSISTYTGKKAVEDRSRGPVIWGYAIRLPVYAVGLYLTVKISIHCMAGCAIGFFVLQIAMLYLYLIKASFKGADENPFKDWDDDVKFNNPDDWEDSEDDDDDWGVPPSWDRSDKFYPSEKAKEQSKSEGESENGRPCSSAAGISSGEDREDGSADSDGTEKDKDPEL